jgi:hypothetical protein
MLTCSCGGRAGFTLVGGWWVCGKCGFPAPTYAKKMVRGHASRNTTESGDDVGLIFFQGGPYDNTAYETEALLGTAALNMPAITEYHWTSEKQTSANTGAVATIWRHDSLVRQTRATVATIAAVPASLNGSASPDDATRVDVPTTAPTAASEALSAAPAPPPSNGDVPPGLDGPTLLARRKALRLSRAQVSEQSGLAQSKIVGIENENAKRIKLAERELLAATLTSAEASTSVGSATGT